MTAQNENVIGHGDPAMTVRLGRLPAKSDTRALLFSRFGDVPTTVPKASNFWRRRRPFPLRSFGNIDWGDCTLAKQATAAMRLERLEVRRTALILDEEVVRVYRALSDREYGGGDNGAYEVDALNNWRRADQTFRDSKGRPLTIDAYVRVDSWDHPAMRAAIWAAAGHGIAVCLNLPVGFSRQLPPADWDIPAGQPLTGEWMAGSWGGHSMWCHDFDEVGFWLDHTWNRPRQRITYAAAAAYLDEAHVVVDSLDAWRKRQTERSQRVLDLVALRAAVNKVSSQKIAA